MLGFGEFYSIKTHSCCKLLCLITIVSEPTRIIDGQLLAEYEIRDVLITYWVYFSTIVNNFCAVGNMPIIKSTYVGNERFYVQRSFIYECLQGV